MAVDIRPLLELIHNGKSWTIEQFCRVLHWDSKQRDSVQRYQDFVAAAKLLDNFHRKYLERLSRPYEGPESHPLFEDDSPVGWEEANTLWGKVTLQRVRVEDDLPPRCGDPPAA